jgi:hypothetical protein
MAERELAPVFQFSGAKIGFNPQDRFMMALGNTLVVVTQDGSVFGADLTATFDSGSLTSDLPLGGSVHLVMRNSGDFTFSCHAHDSGLDNIDYVVSAVLMTPSGIAFTFQHSGNVEGTTAGLPFGTPRRDDDFITGGNNPSIANEFGGMPGAQLVPSIAGKDTLVRGLEGELADLLKTAGEELGKAAAGAIIALVF